MFESGGSGDRWETAAFGVTPDLPAGAVSDVGATTAVLADEAGSPGAMALLAAIDPAHLDPGSQIDLIRAWERQAAWVAAQQLAAVAAFTDGDPKNPAPAGVLPDLCREELATALALSGGAAQRMLDVARTLRDRLPDTAAALARGDLSFQKAALIADRVADAEDQTTAAVQARVLPKAGRQTLGELRGALARAVHAFDPDGAAQRASRARAKRAISTFTLADGMAGMWTLLPAEDLATVMAGLDADAARVKQTLLDQGVPLADIPGLDARRVDALVEWARRALAEPALPSYQRRRPNVQVTVALTTLLGLDEQPAELVGYGPIDAQTARRIATDGTWRRLLTDPKSGTLLDYGRTVYQPPADLREFVLARDPVCVFPGCRRPARHCQLDHLHSWEAGGSTCATNLGPECHRHHRCKSIGGWNVVRTADGSFTWTSPTGKTYTVEPAAVGPPACASTERAGDNKDSDVPVDQGDTDADDRRGQVTPHGDGPDEDPSSDEHDGPGDEPPF